MRHRIMIGAISDRLGMRCLFIAALALAGVAHAAHAQAAHAQASQAQASQATPRAPVERRFPADSGWRRVWVVTSDSTTDAFVEPRQVVASGNLVVVLDAGTREVRALDARTGAARFVITPRGQGPGEFKRPSMLASTPSGFAVLDQANARLTAFDQRGRRAWDIVVDHLFDIDGLCVRTGPRVVTKLKRRDSSLVEYDSTGRRVAVRSFPWNASTPRGDPGFAHSAFTSEASALGDCVIAPMFGAEWAVATASGPLRVFGVREPGLNAEVSTKERILQRSLAGVVVQTAQSSDTKAASRGALVRGDTAIIYAAHTRRDPLKLLDYYSTRTGLYLFSRKLPFVMDALTIGTDGTYYGIRIGTTQQVIVAMRPERVTSASRPAR